MNEEYLWDRSGPPDIEVARLEKLLRPLGQGSGKRQLWWLAVAATVLLCAGICISRGRATEWRQGDRQLRTGERVQAGMLEASRIGQVELEAGSDLRLKGDRFELRRGTMHALIWAAPGEFVVDTPGARTIDLGCRYTLNVAEDGTGVITVEIGLVAFEWGGKRSLVPAGAMCRTRRNQGPGTPYFIDAPEALKMGIERFDSGDESGLRSVLEASRPQDAMTLRHLLDRTGGEDRRLVAKYLANREEGGN